MEEKERFEYYPKQNQLYDKINDELYCLGIKQDKTRLVDFLNLMNEDWWTLYEKNKELREENQQLKQQLAEKQKENATLEAMLAENANDRKTMQEFKIGEDEYDLTDEDARNSLCWEVKELKQQLHDLPKKIVDEIKENNTYFNSSKPNQKNHIYDSYLIEAKTLDSILKKYGGEDE